MPAFSNVLVRLDRPVSPEVGSPAFTAPLMRALDPGTAFAIEAYWSGGNFASARPRREPTPVPACAGDSPGTALVTELTSGLAASSCGGSVEGGPPPTAGAGAFEAGGLEEPHAMST